jgi:hypothetical protein
MGPIVCPEKVRNYHSALSSSPEERRSHAKLSVTCIRHCTLSVKSVNTLGNKAAIKLNLGLHSNWSGDMYNFIKILIFTE